MAISEVPTGRVATAETNTCYSLTLLGEFDLRHGDETVPLPPASQRVVACLAIKSHPCRRRTLAEWLFVDREPRRAAGNLRSTLHRVNGRAPGLVTGVGDRVRIGSVVDIDIRRVDRMIDFILHPEVNDAHPGPRGTTADELDRDPATFSTELLPGWADDWVLGERERLRQRCLHALEAVGRRHLRAGRIPDAIDTALVAIEMEPLREVPYRLLVESHVSEGNFGEAMKSFRRFRRLLLDEIGLEPTAELTALLPTAVLAAAGDTIATSG